MSKFRFPSISWELLDIFSSNFIFMHSYWQDLAWDCYKSFSPHLFQSYGPWFTSKFHFRSISWELLDIFSPNWYQSYGPWFTPKFCFRTTSWELTDIFSPNFIYAFILTRSSLGSSHHFSHICTRVMALDLRQNLVSFQYLEKKCEEFHQILYMLSYWQDLLWDCYTFFAHLCQSYGPWFTLKFRFRSISSEEMDKFWPNFI